MYKNVNHPLHYQGCSKIGQKILSNSEFPKEHFNSECIDVIESLNLGFCLGNAIKYLWRVGDKKTWWKYVVREDLKKAKWYLERYLTNQEDTINNDLAESLHLCIVYYLINN